MTMKKLGIAIHAAFPNLNESNHDVTSPYEQKYNCIAHAASNSDFWWWPVKAPGVYWPLPHYMEETMACFTAAYASLGYVACTDDKLEIGIEKIAVYADALGKPTHAARQLNDGSWTSKLGRSQDIRHAELSVLEGKPGFGNGYGKVAMIMSRAANANT